jgi:hypothetical protein
MGFQPSDLNDFARSLLQHPGVTEVWKLASLDDRSATLWVLVRGFDAQAFENRLAVRRHIEHFIEEHQPAIRASEFVFSYYVEVDDEGLAAPQIPDGAERIAA